jgi:hypothetical protein
VRDRLHATLPPPCCRAYKHFWARVGVQIGLCKKNQAHGCPICKGLKTDLGERKRLQLRLRVEADADERSAARLQLQRTNVQIQYAEFHAARKYHQRGATQSIRDSLPNQSETCREELWFIDYVSFYKASGAKQNVLVIEVGHP